MYSSRSFGRCFVRVLMVRLLLRLWLAHFVFILRMKTLFIVALVFLVCFGESVDECFEVFFRCCFGLLPCFWLLQARLRLRPEQNAEETRITPYKSLSAKNGRGVSVAGGICSLESVANSSANPLFF